MHQSTPGSEHAPPELVEGQATTRILPRDMDAPTLAWIFPTSPQETIKCPATQTPESSCNCAPSTSASPPRPFYSLLQPSAPPTPPVSRPIKPPSHPARKSRSSTPRPAA